MNEKLISIKDVFALIDVDIEKEPAYKIRMFADRLSKMNDAEAKELGKDLFELAKIKDELFQLDNRNK